MPRYAAANPSVSAKRRPRLSRNSRTPGRARVADPSISAAWGTAKYQDVVSGTRRTTHDGPCSLAARITDLQLAPGLQTRTARTSLQLTPDLPGLTRVLVALFQGKLLVFHRSTRFFRAFPSIALIFSAPR